MGSSCTSGSGRKTLLLEADVFIVAEDSAGDAGLSCNNGNGGKSSDEVELEYRTWPRAENVGVSGDATSEDEEFVVASA